MANSDVSWINIAYDLAALTGVFLCVYVMQKVEVDRISKIDPSWLQWIRRLWFIVLALVLCYSITNESWQPTLPVLFLVMVGVGNLMINAVALHLRSPADGGPKLVTRAHGSISPMRAVKRFLARNFLP